MFIAKIPCTFAGKRYYPGDEVPREVIVSPAAQVSMGVLVEAGVAKGAAEPILIPVLAEGAETGTIPVPAESIAEAIRIRQLPQARELQEIEACQDKDVLLVLELIDKGKSALAAIRKRQEELKGSAGDA